MSGRRLGEYNDFRSVPISPVYFFIDIAFLTALVVLGVVQSLTTGNLSMSRAA